MIIFEPTNHVYKKEDGTIFNSVTSIINTLKEPFDSDVIAGKSSRGRGKWKGIDPETIKEIWEREKNRSIELGNWYHDQRENDVKTCETLIVRDKEVPIIHPTETKELKFSPSQKLQDGVYPEFLVYLNSAQIAGQIDRLEVSDGFIDIIDYKTNKEIKMESYVNWEGISKKMKHPVSHLDDCNYWHYALQLSIYMYMLLKQNPKLKPGKLIIQHVEFEKESEDEYGYPILLLENGSPIIKDIHYIECPYLAKEVFDIFVWLKNKNYKI